MEIDRFHNKVNDPRVAQLIDNILDTVLALKARLRNSNMDSNSIGGINIYHCWTTLSAAHYRYLINQSPLSLATCSRAPGSSNR
jgi:hypothetical protein